MAQSVFSVNSVGYVNVTLSPNYTLISNPLNGTNNNIKTIMPVAPDQSQSLRWNPVTQHFAGIDTYYVVPEDTTLNGWYDSGLNPSVSVINPGESFFFFNPGASTSITFVGDVPQGNLTNTLSPNYSFRSSIVPQSASLESIGFPAVDQLQYFTWNPVTQHYSGIYTYYIVPEDTTLNGFYDSGLNRVFPTPDVGQGFVIFNPTASNVQWGRTFSVN